MEIQNKIGEQVFDKLRSKFKQITLGDADGNSTQNPADAVFFNFNYIDQQGHDHGNITVSLIDGSMKIYYSKNISKELEGSELSDWYKFLQDMRKTAMSNLYRFDTHDISKSALDITDIQATVARNDMNESKMYGTTKSSYQECGPAKVIIRHNQRIDPEVRGARSRKVESIFVETEEGERFKMPFTSLPGARAMARHVGNGGRPHDSIGESIVTMVNEIAELRPFIARNRNAVFEDETTMEMIEAAKEYYNETRKTLGKIKGKRGYQNFVESLEEDITEDTSFDDETAEKMKDRFTRKRFSDKMEAAMPIVHKAYNRKNMTPQAPKRPLEEFEEWAEEAGTIHIEETEEMCPEACCGKPVSKCHCGPECPHCDCHAKNNPEELEEAKVGAKVTISPKALGSAAGQTGTIIGIGSQRGTTGKRLTKKIYRVRLDNGEETMIAADMITSNVSEVKSGPFNSKAIGNRVKIRGVADDGSDHIGKTGTIKSAEREHTFSAMRPFVVLYRVVLDDTGEIVWVRRENVTRLKDQPVTEGTWAIPDTPEKMARLKELLSSPLQFGPNGENATNAMYGLLGDDELADAIYAGFELLGPEEDAVPYIKDWIQKHAPEYAVGITESIMLESEELTDDITSMLINRIAKYVPEVFSQHGPEHVYNIVRDNVAWITDDWPEDEGFGSSDSYGAWKSTMRDLGIDEEEYRARVDKHMQGLAGPAEVPESRGRASHERMHKGDVVLPKATYSDYLEIYKSRRAVQLAAQTKTTMQSVW
jgi:hypothetical protein